jgi:hypothetical protein
MYVTFLVTSFLFVQVPVTQGLRFFQKTGKIMLNDDRYGWMDFTFM